MPLAKILASEKTAAAMLDLDPRQFRELVESGVLPRPANLPGFEKQPRWRVAELEAIASGAAMEDEFEP
ncbi:MAG: hypothetical protein AAGF50_14995 [Pseudomonadota bacterium]